MVNVMRKATTEFPCWKRPHLFGYWNTWHSCTWPHMQACICAKRTQHEQKWLTIQYYRVTQQVDPNLPLTSKQKLHFGLARSGQSRTFVWSQWEVWNYLLCHPVHVEASCNHETVWKLEISKRPIVTLNCLGFAHAIFNSYSGQFMCLSWPM